jgi:hypothetical protein
VRAERRTPRNYRERAALAVLGYYPYRCVACERRFLDRPLSQPSPDDAETGTPAMAGSIPAAAVVAAEMDPPVMEPTAAEHTATLAIGEAPRHRRRTRWVVDPGNTPLGRSEIYALLLAAGVLLLVGVVVLRLMWPEARGGVRLFD